MVYQKSKILIGERFYGEAENVDLPVDLIRYSHWPAPLNRGYQRAPRYTQLIDLTRTEDELLAAIKHTPRQEIRQAQREALHCDFQFPATVETTLWFCDLYETFDTLRSSAPVDRSRLEALAQAEKLEINRVVADGVTLATHLHVRTASRTVLIHSCSAFRAEGATAKRNRVARANRFLHWQEFLRWKHQGIDTFDFGGWYDGKWNRKLLQINAFKEGLGGKVAPIHNAMVALTLRGQVALGYLLLVDCTRRWTAAITSAVSC